MGWFAELKRYVTFYLLLRNYSLFFITFAASSLITWLAVSYQHRQQAPPEPPPAPPAAGREAIKVAPVPAVQPVYSNLRLDPPIHYYRIIEGEPSRSQVRPEDWSRHMAQLKPLTAQEVASLKIDPSDYWYMVDGMCCTGMPYKEHPLDFTEAFVFEFDCGHTGIFFKDYDPQDIKREPGEWFGWNMPFADRCMACLEAEYHKRESR